MFRRLVITSIFTTLAIMGSATTLRDLQPTFELPGVTIAGVFTGANAACGAANLLRFFLRQKSVHDRPGRPIDRHFGSTFGQVTANARKFLTPAPAG
ncbi:hypothetical protein [Acrocarpospora pleiomorpha]|uniref:hypothetical protein n=1 Tax=Acrocarpospora pleiomorpha TaxID=90975 RepID=UPI0012D2A7DC|nr:hypothetical protein [Acrocarpospora pleiomorpha]